MAASDRKLKVWVTQSKGQRLRPQDVIRKKRDGEQLTREEITFFIEGVTRGTIADYQISALLMAIFLKGMNDVEQEILTDAM
ncbi:MAG: hypothetical protein ABR501_05835, partial [Pyrinomonadaceae bacterium]